MDGKDLPREINYMPDISLFMKMWDNPNHKGNSLTEKYFKTNFGNINYTGQPGDISGPSFTIHQADFYDSLENGIRDLILVISKTYNLITYTSCEGHFYNDVIPATERHVGILPRNERELIIIQKWLSNIITYFDLHKTQDVIQLKLSNHHLSDEFHKMPVIDLYFKKNNLVSWQEYFTILDTVFQQVLGLFHQINYTGN